SHLLTWPCPHVRRRVLCAAPSYLQWLGTPSSPTQLQEHDCLCFMLGDDVHDRWRFERPGEQASLIRVRAINVSNDGDVVRRWALLGKGIAYKAYFDVAQDLAQGRLQAICQDWIGELTPLHLLVAGRA